MNKHWQKATATVISITLLAATITSCAQKPQNIQATYVSPVQYQHYSCDQIGQEMGRVGRKVTEVTGAQQSAANKDGVAMGVGLIVFWPALFFLIGGDRKEELARLKGEHEALEAGAIEKNCTTVLAKLEEARRIQEELEREQEEKKKQDMASDWPHG